ncbi:transposase [Streptomyces sp. 142MFCol3.1]|uniref:transposase n=1 Tax=Streptomyces sp. 142MFCol3.1 TaxID=1172179 RepID=UPI00048E46D8|nr:transposase [Streptomyces sp. 142MFCol3.1]
MTANVLDSLPKSTQPAAKRALAEIYNADGLRAGGAAVEAFARQHDAKFPDANIKITDDGDELPARYDFPVGYRVHLRTTEPLESDSAGVRPRIKAIEEAGSGTAGLATAFKLVESARNRWCAANAPYRVVRARAPFECGPTAEPAPAAAV